MSVELEAALWGGAVGAVLGAVAGGAVSWVLEVGLTGRRQKIALSVALQNHFDDFCGKSAAYWQTSGQNAFLEAELVRDLEGQRRKVLRYVIVAGLTNIGDIKRTLKLIYNQTTGGPFATAARMRDPERLQAIRTALELLHVQLKLM